MHAPRVRVGDLAEQIRGVTYNKADASRESLPGYLPVLRAGNITDRGLTFDDLVYVPASRVSGKQKIRRHDVVIAASSGSLDVVGKAATAVGDFEGSFGAFCKVLRPNSQVDPYYFAQYFRTQSYRRRISALAAGANINNLRSEHLDEMKIPLPPLGEQRRIAEVLDRAEAVRAKRREALARLNELTQSLFLDMFGHEKSREQGWKSLPLGELVDDFRYGTSNKSQEGGYPALRIPNVVDGKIDISKLKTVPVSQLDLERLRLVDGDILFVRTNGNPDFVGRCAVYNGDAVEESGYSPDDFIYASYLIRARPKLDRIVPVYLREYMLSAPGRRALRARCKTSAGQFNINTKGLGSIDLPVPPLSLQREFGRRVEAIEALKDGQRGHLAGLDALYSSLQDRAFSGRL